eukprot:Skav201444  [mRNA]  locus=scaffold6:138319:139023:- [translate_table: standard]
MGIISATLCGPPCETYSEARFMPLDGQLKKPPRPLRSHDRILGLEGLTYRELLQVHQGSMFVLQTQLALGHHLRAGGLFVKEHPALPTEPTRPSTWTMPLTDRLPELSFFQLGQWHFGAKTAKPTGLLVARLPRFFSSVWQRRLSGISKPTGQSIGFDTESNCFRTTSLKEYPAAFSSALAGAVSDQIQANVQSGAYHVVTEVDSEAFDWLLKAAEASSAIYSWATMQADFQHR